MTADAKLAALERALPQRTREQRVTEAPVEFRLGGEPVSLRVLKIAEAREWKRYASEKLAAIAGTPMGGEQLVELLQRIMRQGVDEQIDLVLRYDVDRTIPGLVIDDEAGLYRSTWVDEHATELEVEDAFLSVVTVGLPFGRRVRQLFAAGLDWTTIVRSLRELQQQPTPTTPRSPTSTS